jgi:putative NADH-flavin reductase
MEQHEQYDRRSYDPRVLGLIEKVNQQQQKIDANHKEALQLEKRVDKLELRQDGAIKDLSEHEEFIKLVNTFITETKSMHTAFDSHMENQRELNKTLSEGLKKATEFQNRLLIVGGAILFLWQAFGAKIFSAAEVLIK